MEAFVPTYLEQAMQNFVQSQEQMREQMEQHFGSMIPMGQMPSTDQMQEMAQRNVEIMQKTMKIFTPFGNAFDPDKKD